MNIYYFADDLYEEFDFQSDGYIERDGWSFNSSSPMDYIVMYTSNLRKVAHLNGYRSQWSGKRNS